MTPNGTNSPEHAQNSVETAKQEEINKVVKETKNALNPFQQIMDKITSVVQNTISALKNFFDPGSTVNKPPLPDKPESPPPTGKKERKVTVETRHNIIPEVSEVQELLKQPLMKNVKENREAFAAGVCALAHKHGGKPEWYIAVIGNETKNTFDPAIQNPNTDATGLFGFMPDTARGMGTSINSLKRMSNIDQLVYVDKYLTQLGATGKINSLSDLYLVVFFPAALAHRDDPSYVFQSKNLSASKVAHSNPMFNKNKDGMITMSEFKNVVNTTIGSRLENVSMTA